MPSTLAIRYLLAGTGLFGGVKVVLRQAELLRRRGHAVSIVSAEPAPAWFPTDVPFVIDSDLRLERLPPADVTVATFWTTIEPALRETRGEIVHYCQGLEFTYTHNVEEHPRIRAAYARDLPALVVSPHLADHLRERFGRVPRVVPQPLEPTFHPDERRAPGSPPRILVTSPFEIDWKGVRTALEALAALRRDGFDFRLVRLSQWPLPAEETALLAADEVHCHLPPPAVADLMRGCDLLLAPSWEQEGFGLPALEAMASGVPVVASDIACYRGFAADAAVLVPFDDPAAFARAARSLLDDAGEWRRRREAGLAVAARYSEEAAGRGAEEALAWVASGAWRRAKAGPR